MSNDLFDLDVQVVKQESSVEPRITSVIFCTPGCDEGTTETSCCFTCGN